MSYKYYMHKPELKEMSRHFSKISYKGVNLWPIVSINAYKWLEEKEKRKGLSFKHKLSRIFSFMFFREKFRIENHGEKKILNSFFGVNQAKYYPLFKENFKSFTPRELTTIRGWNNQVKSRKQYGFKFPNPLKILRIYRSLNKRPLRDVFGDYISFLYFIMAVYHSFGHIDDLEKIVNELNPKAYISMSCAGEKREQVLTQLMKLKKKPTFSLQHGVMLNYEKEFNVDCILYDNMTADYFLVWGDKTKKTSSKYIDKKKIMVIGNPLYEGFLKPKKKFNPKKGVVFLSHVAFVKNNLQLVKIVNDFAKKNPLIKIIIHTHPMDDPKNYEKLITEPNISFSRRKMDLKDKIKEGDFVILHNTTVSLEALQFQIPRFRFKDKDLIDTSKPKQDLFDDTKDLDKKFNDLKNNKKFAKLLKDYKKIYEENFFQPKKSNVSRYCKKLVLEKIRN